jgi:hypothetical protein
MPVSSPAFFVIAEREFLPWGGVRLDRVAAGRGLVNYYRFINPSLHPPVGRESHIATAFFLTQP